jgi:hypothetical protein
MCGGRERRKKAAKSGDRGQGQSKRQENDSQAILSNSFHFQACRPLAQSGQQCNIPGEFFDTRFMQD